MFLITFFIFVLTELILLDRSRRALNQSLDKALRARVEGLTSITDEEVDGKIEFDFSDKLMPDYGHPNPHAYFIIRRLPYNSEIARSASLKETDLTLPEPVSDILLNKPVFWYSRLDGRTIRFIAVRERVRREIEEDEEDAENNDGERISTLPTECLFIVGMDTKDLNDQFRGIVKLTSTALGAGLIILLLAGGIAVSRSLKPLSILEREVQTITESKLVPVSVPDVREIAGVARTLNDALGRLKEAFERERRFKVPGFRLHSFQVGPFTFGVGNILKLF